MNPPTSVADPGKCRFFIPLLSAKISSHPNFKNYFYVYVHAHMHMGAHGDQNRASVPLKLALGSCELPMWALGTKLRSSRRTARTLNH